MLQKLGSVSKKGSQPTDKTGLKEQSSNPKKHKISAFRTTSVDISDEIDTHHRRMDLLHKIWPSKNQFVCGGRIIRGPSNQQWFAHIIELALLFFIISHQYTLAPHFYAKLNGSALLHSGQSTMDTIDIIGIIVSIILTIVEMAMLYSYHKIVNCDPGIVMRRYPTIDESLLTRYGIPISSLVGIDEIPMTIDDLRTHPRYCFTCREFRTTDTHHCSICDNCIEHFDHHCMFLGTCIGRNNHKYFLSFLSLASIGCAMIMALCVLHMIDHRSTFGDASQYFDAQPIVWITVSSLSGIALVSILYNCVRFGCIANVFAAMIRFFVSFLVCYTAVIVGVVITKPATRKLIYSFILCVLCLIPVLWLGLFAIFQGSIVCVGLRSTKELLKQSDAIITENGLRRIDWWKASCWLLTQLSPPLHRSTANINRPPPLAKLKNTESKQALSPKNNNGSDAPTNALSNETLPIVSEQPNTAVSDSNDGSMHRTIIAHISAHLSNSCCRRYGCCAQYCCCCHVCSTSTCCGGDVGSSDSLSDRTKCCSNCRTFCCTPAMFHVNFRAPIHEIMLETREKHDLLLFGGARKGTNSIVIDSNAGVSANGMAATSATITQSGESGWDLDRVP